MSMEPKVSSFRAFYLPSPVLRFIISLSACMAWVGIVYPAEWRDPPVIEMDECIPVERSITKNPFSDAPHDFALVTKYQERGEQAAKTSDKTLYLVNGIFLHHARQSPVVYFTAVIIDITIEDQGLRRISHWVLADTKSDGKMNRALFREKQVSNSGEESIVSEVQGSEEEIAALQTYFERGDRNLNSKADGNLPENCDKEGTR